MNMDSGTIIRLLLLSSLLLSIVSLVLDYRTYSKIKNSDRKGSDLSKDFYTLYVISSISRVIAVLLALSVLYSF